jgi:hypothetical protein
MQSLHKLAKFTPQFFLFLFLATFLFKKKNTIMNYYYYYYYYYYYVKMLNERMVELMN